MVRNHVLSSCVTTALITTAFLTCCNGSSLAASPKRPQSQRPQLPEVNKEARPQFARNDVFSMQGVLSSSHSSLSHVHVVYVFACSYKINSPAAHGACTCGLLFTVIGQLAAQKHLAITNTAESEHKTSNPACRMGSTHSLLT